LARRFRDGREEDLTGEFLHFLERLLDVAPILDRGFEPFVLVL